MSTHNHTRTLPEELISLVCDHYASQRQLGSLAQLMRLNRRTSAYARSALYRQYDIIDNRTSRLLNGAEAICDEYEDGEALDRDILAAIDCREVDPLDLDPAARWLRNIRSIRTVEIRDMLYGRDTESILTLARSLARRGILLFPNLKEVIISAQVVRRIHTAESKYPKSTPMDILILLFLGSQTTTLRISDSTAFSPPMTYHNHMGRPMRNTFPPQLALPSTRVGHLTPPSQSAHFSHAIIQYMDGMPSLQHIIYERVDPFVPVKPKKGVKHTISFRPYAPPFVTDTSTTVAASSNSTGSRSWPDPNLRETDERSYIWEIRQAIIDIVQRSVVSPEEMASSRDTDEINGMGSSGATHVDNETGEREEADEEEDDGEEEDEDEDEENDHRPPSMVPPTRQSSWRFIFPFSSESSEWTSTLRLQVRDRIRRRYDHDLELMEEVLENMSFEFKES